MPRRVLAIPMDGDDEATEELSRFLCGKKVVSVEKVAVVDKAPTTGRCASSSCRAAATRTASFA